MKTLKTHLLTLGIMVGLTIAVAGLVWFIANFLSAAFALFVFGFLYALCYPIAEYILDE